MKAAGGMLLCTGKLSFFFIWAGNIFFQISEDKTGADGADGSDKIKPPPEGTNSGTHVEWLFTGNHCNA